MLLGRRRAICLRFLPSQSNSQISCSHWQRNPGLHTLALPVTDSIYCSVLAATDPIMPHKPSRGKQPIGSRCSPEDSPPRWSAHSHKLLLDVTDADRAIQLKLRLLHVWSSYAPSDPTKLFNYCTLWCDEMGTLIHGLAPTTLTDHFNDLIKVGRVYVLGGLDLQPPRNSYRPCSHRLHIVLSRNTTFADETDASPNFMPNSFEFVSFASLHPQTISSSQLIDIIGRVVSITGVNYSKTNYGRTTRQNIVLENKRSHSHS
ncbi:unnamed protein product [Linum trigynum]|uniref:Uncharacterized protein n=1 Tax=Linum trigynum TaxID=586398 RepID=A0AAV2FBG3_9ROSI